MLAYITGTVNLELLWRTEDLAVEDRALKAQLKTPLQLTDAERVTLAEIAHRLGSKALEDVAKAAKPDTILRLVSKVNSTQVRWFEVALVSGSPHEYFGLTGMNSAVE